MIVLGACTTQPVPTAPLTPAQEGLIADGAQLCALVRENYVYLDGKAAAWDTACAELPARAATASTGPERLRVLEDLTDTLYDAHVSFGANSGQSPRLVPSGNDYWLEDGQVTGVRPGGNLSIIEVARSA